MAIESRFGHFAILNPQIDMQVIAADRIVPGLEYLQGVLRLSDGLIFIHDLDRFLSLEEEKSLTEALQGLEAS